MNRFHGTGIALITPFKSDKSVDLEALGKVVDHVIKGGAEYLVVMGTTAENPTLSAPEKNSIIKFIVEKNAGRLPIVLGAGGADTQSAIDNLLKADLTGIDAILSVTPYYNKPNQSGLIEHFSAIAQTCPLPIILYNVPGRTGINMSAQTTLTLANKFENIIAIKEASGNVDQIMEIIEHKPSHFDVISGDDGLTLPLISVGAIGVISVVGNAFPQEFSNMVRLALQGKYSEAKEIHYKLLDFIRLIFAEGSPTGVKFAMAKLGLIENNLRLPLVPASPHLMEKINLWFSKK